MICWWWAVVLAVLAVVTSCLGVWNGAFPVGFVLSLF